MFNKNNLIFLKYPQLDVIVTIGAKDGASTILGPQKKFEGKN